MLCVGIEFQCSDTNIFLRSKERGQLTSIWTGKGSNSSIMTYLEPFKQFFLTYFRFSDWLLNTLLIQTLSSPKPAERLLPEQIFFFCLLNFIQAMRGKITDSYLARDKNLKRMIICFHSLSLNLFLFFYRVLYCVLVVCYFSFRVYSVHLLSAILWDTFQLFGDFSFY